MGKSSQSTNSSQNQSSTNNVDTSGSQTGSTNPAAFQFPYLQQAFQGASNALNQAGNGAPAPTGFTAQYTPEMLNAFQQALGYGTNNSNIPGASANAGGALTGAGTNAATSGLFGLANFTPQGGTQSNITAANAYADNPFISQMVSGAMRDANQQFTDSTNPMILRNAAGTNNIDSTAPQVQQGIVQRGLAQKAGDISALLRGNAYEGGLNLAQSGSNAMNSYLLQALTGAAGGGTGAVNSGVNANSGAINQQGGLFDIANGGVNGLLSGNQANLTNQNQSWQFGVNSPFAALQNYFNIVGNKPWGSQTVGNTAGNTASTGTTQGTGSSTTTSSPSTLSMLGSILGMAGSFLD